MMISEPFSVKQKEFILNATKSFNLAHGSVRSGKTQGVLYAFLQAAMICPGDQIWIIGYTHDTVYHNCIREIFDETKPHFRVFAPFCTWAKGDRVLHFGDKKIYCLGSKDEGAVKAIQGKTMDLCYCNEMTLFPENVIQMIISRLSNPFSKLFADMNPVQPDHICKKMIDMAEAGDDKYYALHFSVNDTPFLSEAFKQTLRQTLTGLFYRRNYLGEWCLAEGAIFDFFEEKYHVEKVPTGTTLHWIAGIDYGTDHAFCCLLARVSKLPRGRQIWIEKEYYYSGKGQKRKSPSEYAEDLVKFFEGYSIRSIYLDPSAALFKAELSRKGYHTAETNNDVYDGIMHMTDAVKNGTVVISPSCVNLIREIKGYVWDPKASKNGEEKPIKKDDDALDALRYLIKSYMKNKTSFVDEEEADRFAGSLAGKRSPMDTWQGAVQRIDWPGYR